MNPEKCSGNEANNELSANRFLISEICRLRGINSKNFVATCVDAHRKGLPSPSLLPDDPVELDHVLNALNSGLKERQQILNRESFSD